MAPEQLDDYIKEVQSVDKLAQTESGHHVQRVLLGLEGDFNPDMSQLQDTLEIYKTKPLDFIIGSLHHQNPIYRKRLIALGLKPHDKNDDKAIIDQYFTDLKDLCTRRIFDV